MTAAKKEKFTKAEIRAALDDLVAQGKLQIVGYEPNGDPICQETEATRLLREVSTDKKH